MQRAKAKKEALHSPRSSSNPPKSGFDLTYHRETLRDAFWESSQCTCEELATFH